MTRWIALWALCSSAAANATGYTDYGQDLVPSESGRVELDGFFRLRGEVLGNLDLDRGPTPSGKPLFPVPLSDAQGQVLTLADTRLRTDLAAYAPGGLVAVKLRLDLLDNLPLGGDPELSPGVGTSPIPAASPGQRPFGGMRLKRAYAEALTPVGLVAAGRMGAHWGLGMLVNGGDCLDCDGGDAADRVMLITPVLDHLVALSYDFSAVGPSIPRADGRRVVDLEPTDDVRTFSLAILNYRQDGARDRRLRSGRTVFEYGAVLSYRRQDNDVPASYLPANVTPVLDGSQVMRRGYQAGIADGWIRLSTPSARVEAEVAVMGARVEQASLVPGVLLSRPVESLQFGGALQTEFGSKDARLAVGMDLGFASGDPAPGFGAYPGSGPAAYGDLDGPQATYPYDTRVDNFRFHSDFRVDRILFREIIGTITDAGYLRPHARFRIFNFSSSRLTASFAAIASRALHASSTPGRSPMLGLELDPTLTYESNDGFYAQLEHALLLPFAGLDNPDLGMKARPAQMVRLRLAYVF